MTRETEVRASDLIYPLFLLESAKGEVEIDSMPGIFRLGLDKMLREIESLMKQGVNAFDIFPVVEESHKDKIASRSYDPEFFYLKALARIKKEFPESCIITDVAMDPYSTDGHDGLVKNGEILNDESLVILGKMALAQAQCGVDVIGPSDMMDRRVGYIRDLLDDNGFMNTSIMSYTAKYASCFYGPFRDALDSAPKSGDKKSYQMDPANRREALLEAELDFQEGADFLMVKPALAYLDVISDLKSTFDVPIAAYNVSGEYSMVAAASERGWLDRKSAVLEILTSIKRSGADLILTYFAKEFGNYR